MGKKSSTGSVWFKNYVFSSYETCKKTTLFISSSSWLSYKMTASFRSEKESIKMGLGELHSNLYKWNLWSTIDQNVKKIFWSLLYLLELRTARKNWYWFCRKEGGSLVMCLLIGEFGKIINVCMFKNTYFTGNKQGAVSDQNGEIFCSLINVGQCLLRMLFKSLWEQCFKLLLKLLATVEISGLPVLISKTESSSVELIKDKCSLRLILLILSLLPISNKIMGKIGWGLFNNILKDSIGVVRQQSSVKKLSC